MSEYKKNFNITLENKRVLILTGMFLAGSVFGAGIFSLFGGGSILPGGSDPIEEHEALKEAVRQQYPEYFEEGFGIDYSGVVEEVKENSIVVRLNIPEIIILASDIEETIEIKVNEDTRIVRNVPKSESEYAQEVAEFEQDYAEYESQIASLPEGDGLGAGLEEPAYPTIEKEEVISIRDIRSGDDVFVSAENETDAGILAYLITVSNEDEGLIDEEGIELP